MRNTAITTASLLLLLFAIVVATNQKVNIQKLQRQFPLKKNSNGVNDRPIIGIMTQPSIRIPGKSMLVASYVKWVEAAGARAVPIHFNESFETNTRLFNSINGILFTGGGQTLKRETPFYQTSELLFNLTLQANRNGDHFPIWGTCQGFQLLAVLASGLHDEDLVLSRFNSWNVVYPLEFTEALSNSTLFASAPTAVVQAFKEKITMNYHHFGISPSKFSELRLDRAFRTLATNTDDDGALFISMFEGAKYPLYGTQFHPEYPAFEWNPKSAVNHSDASVYANGYLGRFFVNEARKSMHQFDDFDQEESLSFAKLTPTYTMPLSGDELTYFWDLP